MAKADPVAPEVVCTRQGHIIVYLICRLRNVRREGGSERDRPSSRESTCKNSGCIHTTGVRKCVQYSIAGLKDDHEAKWDKWLRDFASISPDAEHNCQDTRKDGRRNIEKLNFGDSAAREKSVHASVIFERTGSHVNPRFAMTVGW